MPNQVDLLLSQTADSDRDPNRGSYLALRSGRRRAVLGLCVFASLRLIAACSSNTMNGTNPDMAVPSDGGNPGLGDGGPGSNSDLALPNMPPPGAFRLNVGIGGSGTGGVTSQPGNINCGAGPTPVCSADYPSGTQVTLTATATGGATFSKWTGDCATAGTNPTCTVTLSANLSATALFGNQFCTPSGICWEAPLPFGYDLNSVWAIAPNNVWAVGNAGAIVHWDGTNWSNVASPTGQNLFDVWARNATDIWVAAGDNGLVLHSADGTSFQSMPTGFTTQSLRLIWGTSDHVYVPAALQNVAVYNGTTWRLDTATARNDTAPNAIAGTGNNDVWLFCADGYIAHFNGAWTSSRLLQDPKLVFTGGLSLSTTDIWSISNPGYIFHTTAPQPGTTAGTGGSGFNISANPFVANANSVKSLWGLSDASMFTTGAPTTIYHLNGTANTNTAYATGVTDISAMSKLHGTSDTDVWAVGAHGVTAHYEDRLV